MGEIVAGLISGILGAIVGGLFTALAARSQVKAAVAVAQLQIQADRAQQIKAMESAQRVMEIDALTDSLLQISHTLQEIAEEHEFSFHTEGEGSNENCMLTSDHIKMGNSWRRIIDTHSFKYPHIFRELGEEYNEYLLEFMFYGIDRDAAMSRVNTAMFGGCTLVRWAETLDDRLTSAVDSLKELHHQYLSGER